MQKRGNEVKILVLAALLISIAFFYGVIEKKSTNSKDISEDLIQYEGMATLDHEIVYWVNNDFRYSNYDFNRYTLFSEKPVQNARASLGLGIDSKKLRVSISNSGVGTLISPVVPRNLLREGDNNLIVYVTTNDGTMHIKESVIEKDTTKPKVTILETVLDGPTPYVRVNVEDKNQVRLMIIANIGGEPKYVSNYITIESESGSEEEGYRATVKVPLTYPQPAIKRVSPPKAVLAIFIDAYGNVFDLVLDEKNDESFITGFALLSPQSSSSVSVVQGGSGTSSQPGGVEEDRSKKSYCPNNIKEGSEQCDGIDKGDCKHGCTANCKCAKPDTRLSSIFGTVEVPPCGDGNLDPSKGEECEGSGTYYCPSGKRCNAELCKCEALTGNEKIRYANFHVDAFVPPEVDIEEFVKKQLNIFAYIWYKYISKEDVWNFRLDIINRNIYTKLIAHQSVPSIYSNYKSRGYDLRINQYPNEQHIMVFNFIDNGGSTSETIRGVTIVNPANTPYSKVDGTPTFKPMDRRDGPQDDVPAPYNYDAEIPRFLGFPSLVSLALDGINSQSSRYTFAHEKFHEYACDSFNFNYVFGFGRETGLGKWYGTKRPNGFPYVNCHIPYTKIDKMLIPLFDPANGFLMAGQTMSLNNYERYAEILKLDPLKLLEFGMKPDPWTISLAKQLRE